jgi:HEAT repeat protein
MNYDRKNAEQLTESLLANLNSPQAGVLMNDLLAEFHRGYPLDNLRRLLVDSNPDVVTVGTWIASELGEKGSPLFGDISHLIGHPEKKVRFSAIDCVLAWGKPSNKAEVASVIKLLNDPDPGVRWKVMDFLSRATRELLEGASSFIELTEPDSVNVHGLLWLIGLHASDPMDVKHFLQSQDPLLRKYGVVAARRMSKNNREPLLYATSLSDPDVKNFASSSITLL